MKSTTSNSTAARGVVFHLEDGTIQSCNPNAARILGYSAEQLIGTSYFEPPWQTIDEDGSVLPPENHPAIASLKTGKPYNDIVVGFYKTNGDLVWLSIDSLPLFRANSTKPYGAVVSFADISDRYTASEPETKINLELNSQAAHSILKSIMADTTDIVFVKDLQGRYIVANQAAASFVGIPLEEILGRDDTELFDRHQARSIMKIDRQVLTQEIACSYEEEIYSTEISKSLFTSKYPWRDERGKICGIIGVSKDITALKQSEQKLRKNEQLLRLALKSANAGTWDWSITTGKTVLSPENYDLYGLNPRQKQPQQDWEDCLHPEDRQRVKERVQQLVSGQLPEFNDEFRIIHPQKGVRWIWGLANLINDDNEIVRLSGINIDITERKQVEEKIHHSEQHLRRILNSLFTFVGVLNSDGILIEVNRPALEVANLQPEDVLNKPFTECYWWSFSTESQARLNKAIASAAAGENVRYDVEIRLSAENYILIDFALVSLLDARGQVEYLIPSGIDVTERKRAKDALQNSEQQLRKVLDSLPVYVGLLTPEGRVITINQTALAGVDLQLEDVVGQPFAETCWWAFSTQIQSQINDAIARAAAGENVHFDTLGRGGGRDNIILVDFSIIPVFSEDGRVEYLIPSGINITEREASKQALQQREYELQLITEVIPQQIWSAAISGQIDYINQRWQDYTGLGLKQMQNHGWASIVHPDDFCRITDAWIQAVRTGTKFDVEARLRGADGTYQWFLSQARPLRNEQGIIIKWYGTNTNITRIKELEETLRQQTEDLIQANQLKDDFLAIVSHELRTPLNPILGWSQLMATGRLDAEKMATGIETIKRNANLQTQLIDDLLDVSRILRGQLKLKMTPLDLEIIIRSALTTVHLIAEAKSIQIETLFTPHVRVLGDVRRLQQVVWNLLSNAIKFTAEGGRVVVKLDRVNTQAQIVVEDNGQGIEPDFLPYVFEHFRQAQSSSTRQYGGLGLGLAIVRHLVVLHGGTVTVESPGVDSGATFKVRLPLTNTDTAEQTDESIDESVTSTRFKGLRILAVDDEIDSLNILTLLLQQKEAEVISVTSANEAIKVFDRLTPDLIISDIGMPEVNGYTLMTQIRALPQGKNVPAIALSAYAREVDRQLSIDAGYQKHISKPIEIKELIATITLLLQSN